MYNRIGEVVRRINQHKEISCALILLVLFASGCGEEWESLLTVTELPGYIDNGGFVVDIIDNQMNPVEDFRTGSTFSEGTDFRDWAVADPDNPESYRLFYRSWYIPANEGAESDVNLLYIGSHYEPNLTNYPFRYYLDIAYPVFYASISYMPTGEIQLPAELNFDHNILEITDGNFAFKNNCGFAYEGSDFSEGGTTMLSREGPIQNEFSANLMCSIIAILQSGAPGKYNTNMYLLNLLHPAVLGTKGKHIMSTWDSGIKTAVNYDGDTETGDQHTSQESAITRELYINRDHNEYFCRAGRTDVIAQQIGEDAAEDIGTIIPVWDENADYALGGKCCGVDRIKGGIGGSGLQELLDQIDESMDQYEDYITVDKSEIAESFIQFINELQTNDDNAQIVSTINNFWDDPDMGPLACTHCLSGEHQPTYDGYQFEGTKRMWSDTGVEHVFDNPMYTICNDAAYISRFGDQWKFLCRETPADTPLMIRTSNRCCGDDSYDCGAVSTDNSSVCMKTTATNYAWVGYDDENDEPMLVGAIKNLGCQDNEVLLAGDRVIGCYMGSNFQIDTLGKPPASSNDPLWYKRGGNRSHTFRGSFFGTNVVADIGNPVWPPGSGISLYDDPVPNPFQITYNTPYHGYLCYRRAAVIGDDGEEESPERMIISECTGTGTPRSDDGDDAAGERLSQGQVAVQMGKTGTDGHYFYCTGEGAETEFSMDLDNKLQTDCDAAQKLVAGSWNGDWIVWTGNYCCGEHDDPFEVYNDPPQASGGQTPGEPPSGGGPSGPPPDYSPGDGEPPEGGGSGGGTPPGGGGSTTPTLGACFGGYRQLNGRLLVESTSGSWVYHKGVVVHNGVMQGCAVDQDDDVNDGVDMADNPEFEPTYADPHRPYEEGMRKTIPSYSNDWLMGYPDAPNKVVLDTVAINDSVYCRYLELPDRDVFCSYNETWAVDPHSDERSHLSYIRWTPQPTGSWVQRAECCKPTQCWNGTICENQFFYNLETDSAAGGDDDGWRCYDGQWLQAKVRYTPDRRKTGYCHDNTMCLWNPSGEAGNEANPICVPAGTYVGDYYCQYKTGAPFANWTTRTKVLADSMLTYVNDHSTAQTEFSLICDSYSDIMTYYDYEILSIPVGGDGLVPGYTSTICPLQFGYKETSGSYRFVDGAGTPTPKVPCTNKFCVLEYGNHAPIIGTTINKNFESGTPGSLKMLGLFNGRSTDCQNQVAAGEAPGDQQFLDCRSNNQAYLSLNVDQRAIVYSTGSFSFQGSWYQTVISHILKFFARIFQLVMGTSTPFIADSLQMIEQNKVFDTVYLIREDMRTIEGMIQTYYPEPAQHLGEGAPGQRKHYLYLNYSNKADSRVSDVCGTTDKWLASSGANYDCTSFGDYYLIYSEENSGAETNPDVGIFSDWKQLTQELRVQ